MRDPRLLHVRMAGIEHHDLVPTLAHDGGKHLDADGRERHHLDAVGTGLGAAELARQEVVEVLVADVYEK